MYAVVARRCGSSEAIRLSQDPNPGFGPRVPPYQVRMMFGQLPRSIDVHTHVKNIYMEFINMYIRYTTRAQVIND